MELEQLHTEREIGRKKRKQKRQAEYELRESRQEQKAEIRKAQGL